MKDKITKIAEKVVEEWLRRGAMSKRLRETLPSSTLTLEEREKAAEIVHNVVRYKLLYNYILQREGKEKTPGNYILLAENRMYYERRLLEYAPFNILISASDAVAGEIKKKGDFLSIINREPETVLSVNLNRVKREKVIEMLKEEGLKSREFIPKTAVITDGRGRYSKVVKDGLAHVQDPSSQMVSLIASTLGDVVLDYCAGNGGKSLTMSYFKNGTVTCYDKNKVKLRNLEKRVSVYNVKINVEYWPRGKFDVVLVDAPCSGLGAASRNPSVKYQSSFKEYERKQIDILNEAKGLVNKYLLYSVCTFTEGETEGVVDKFLSSNRNFCEVTLEDLLQQHSQIMRYKDYFKKSNRGFFITSGDIMYLCIFKKK